MAKLNIISGDPDWTSGNNRYLHFSVHSAWRKDGFEYLSGKILNL